MATDFFKLLILYFGRDALSITYLASRVLALCVCQYVMLTRIFEKHNEDLFCWHILLDRLCGCSICLHCFY